MWVRLGRWVEFGIHFGRQNRSIEALDRYLVHASLRCGNREWKHGPDYLNETRIPPLGNLPSARIDLYPDPEPLRWGVRKVVSASGPSARDTEHRSYRS
jgi:hypothetical protein